MKPNRNSATPDPLQPNRTPIPLQWADAAAVPVAVRQVQSRETTVWRLTGDSGYLAGFDAPSPVLSAHGPRIHIEASIASVSRLHRIWRQPQERTVLQMGGGTGG